MKINIKGDVKKAQRFLIGQQKQIPFATSVAINKTAQSIQRVEKRKIRADLDRPTPQVVNSIRIKRSSKRDLTGAVFVLPAIARFLRWQIEGGFRAPRGFAEAVPVEQRLNKYGNIAGRRQGKIGKILAKPDVFSATINGVAGIWQRGRGRQRNKKVKLLIAYENRVRYIPRFPFYRYAEAMANRVWRKHFRSAISRALRSAR